MKLRFLRIGLLLMLLLQACTLGLAENREPTGSPLAPAVTPSATPFLPASPTNETGEVGIWIDPSVPAQLSEPLLDLVNSSQGRYILTEDIEAAQVRVEPQPERPLTQWVYALVTAFPSLKEEVSLEELHRRWMGTSEEGLLLSEQSLALLQKGFGVEPGDTVVQVGDGQLLETAWALSDRLSIIPFEDLEPRWKVLHLDGQSPIEKSFQSENYPLLIPFGLSGPPSLLDEIERRLNWPATNRDPERMTVVVMTGVTALTRATAWQMERRGVLYPAEAIGDWLREADITHISNEVSFWPECPFPDPVQEGLKFCSDPDYLPLLESIGVDVVELTGNHNKDFGSEPFLGTLEIYEQAGWLTFGGGQDLEDALLPAVLEHNGNRIAFLGCNMPGPRYAWATETTPGAAPCSETSVQLAEIERLRAEGVLPIFTFQWSELASPSEAQREAFRAAAEAGAVIVSGSQAHQPQPLAFEAGALIHYGLGNLFFDQMQNLALRQQFIDRHVIYEGRHISTQLLTSLLENYSRPRPMQPEERDAFLERIFRQSGW
ncbi:MAG: CapA family protein [Anaerolineales bacterium]|jgi:poly-gamma-glutamate synthesis protein (capsule biosynthesis protein)